MIKKVKPLAVNRMLHRNPTLEKTTENFGKKVMKDIEIIDNTDIKKQDSIIGDDVAKVRQSEHQDSECQNDSIGFHELLLVNYSKMYCQEKQYQMLTQKNYIK